jgi:hypothetical protein
MKLRREKLKLRARKNFHVKLPLIKSQKPKVLSLTNVKIEELLG